MKVVVLAGTHTGVGTTSVAVGLMQNFREMGLRVQGFKIGPGFMENDLFEAATGRMAVNLDPWMVPKDYLLTSVHRYADECDVGVIDGCGGLFDCRTNANGEWSTAELAKLLNAPVLLVVDAAPLGHSAAALVKGFECFDRRLRVAGVVLNRVADREHASMLGSAMQRGGVKAGLVGWSAVSGDLTSMEEWRWGQQRPNANMAADKYVITLGSLITENFKLDKILEIGATPRLPKCPPVSGSEPIPATPVKIAVAKDAAFSFYYHENFVMLEAAGAELVFFSPLEDDELPSGVSGLYFGGGHPEAHAQRLSENKSLIASVRAFAAAGGVVYAEGGGLLYLSKSIQTIGEFPHDLVGLFPYRTRIEDTMNWRSGYVETEILRSCRLFPPGLKIKGHVCHRTQVVEEIIRSGFGSVENNDKEAYQLVYRLHQEGRHCVPTLEGYSWGNVLASYVHLQFSSNPATASALVAKCQEVDVAAVGEEVKKAVRMAEKPAGCIALSRAFTESNFNKPQQNRSLSFDSGKRNTAFLLEAAGGHLTSPNKRYSMENQYLWQTSTLWSSASSVSGSSEGDSCARDKSKASSDDDYYERAKRSDSSLASSTGRESDLPTSVSSDNLVKSGFAKKKLGNNKIVALSPAAVEIVCALGLESRMIGLTNLCTYPGAIQQGKALAARTKFDASRLDNGRLEMKLKEFWCKRESAFEVNEEFLRQEQPGMVLVEEGGDPGHSSIKSIFSTRKGSFGGLVPVQPTTILPYKIHRLSEVFDYMLKVGEAGAVGDSAARIVDSLRSRVARVGSLVSANPPKEKVVVLTGLNPLVLGGYWIPEMTMLAGGEPQCVEPGKQDVRITWEQLKDMQPDTLILAASTWEETKQELAQLASLPGWWGLPAMRTGHLFVCEHSLFTIPGPRLVDGIELLARILHPNVAGHYGKKGMAMSCILRNGRRCRACNLSRHFCTLL